MAKRSLFWFRRDLRLSDNPALQDALAAADETLLLFIMDEAVAERAGEYRRAYLADSLAKLDESVGGKLAVISGTVPEVLQDVIGRYGISSVHAAHEYAPYGVAAEAALSAKGISVEYTGSSYAVAPGRVQKPDGSNYRVYTPFYRAWLSHGWRDPAPTPIAPNFATPVLGDRHLRWGEIHPRTLLSGLNQSSAQQVFRKEIAWREFYADVLHHYPRTSRDYYSPNYSAMRYDKPDAQFRAWCAGLTGYPIVDAGMRQLRQEGWMHNRVRMIVASFLVKDLHIEWQYGANFFMKFLIDNDVASNSHGWHWTAGCGTDASPYYRVFNPTEQGRRFDPDGSYIRTYIPELAHLSATDIHTPWEVLDGLSHGYPAPIVDHAQERLESLARLEEIKVSKEPYPHQSV